MPKLKGSNVEALKGEKGSPTRMEYRVYAALLLDGESNVGVDFSPGLPQTRLPEPSEDGTPNR